MKKLLSIMILSILALSAQAANKLYVSDVLHVQLREGPGRNFTALKSLRSGTPLAFIEAKNDFTHVKTPSGVTGWIASRYLVEDPIAKDQLEVIKEEYRALEDEYNNLIAANQDLASLTARVKELTDRNTVLEKEFAELKTISDNSISINQKNKDLLRETQAQKHKIDLLTNENDILKTSQENTFLLYGVGILVFGILLGWIILPRSRGSSGGSDVWV